MIDLSAEQSRVRDDASKAARPNTSTRAMLGTIPSKLTHWWSCVLFPARCTAPIWKRSRVLGALALLAAVSAAILFPNLAYHLLEPDEGRYAEIGREMVASGDWFVPTLYYRPYYDKPPLFYWLIAASFRVFGLTSGAARLVPAAATFLTVLATFLFGSRAVGPRAGFLGALALTLSVGFANFGRVLIFDGVLTLLITLSLFAAYEAVRNASFRWRWWFVSSICCGLGVLTKGPVALALLVPPLVAHNWLTRNPIRPTLRQWVGYLGVMLGVTTPWFAATIASEPGFAYHFFWRHHLLRFFGGEFHPKPLWYYVPVLWVACLPWSLLLIPFLRFLLSRQPAVRSLRSGPFGFFLVWAGWCVLLFSLSRGKLPPYVLPAFPAIALMIGCLLESLVFTSTADEFLRQASARSPLQMTLLLCGGAIAVNVATWLVGPRDASGPLVESTLWAIGIVALFVGRGRLAGRPAWALCFLTAAAVNLESTQRLIPAWAAAHTPIAQFGETATLMREPDTAIACYGREWGSIAFYSRCNSILNFSNLPQEDLTRFLLEHDRTLLFMKRTADLDWFLPAIPAGMQITKIEECDNAIVALVTSAPARVASSSPDLPARLSVRPHQPARPRESAEPLQFARPVSDTVYVPLVIVRAAGDPHAD